MEKWVSKSKFTAGVSKYIRNVQDSGRELVVTDRRRPVIKIVPYRAEAKASMRGLLGSVIYYDDPTGPLRKDQWEAVPEDTRGGS